MMATTGSVSRRIPRRRSSTDLSSGTEAASSVHAKGRQVVVRRGSYEKGGNESGSGGGGGGGGMLSKLKFGKRNSNGGSGGGSSAASQAASQAASERSDERSAAALRAREHIERARKTAVTASANNNASSSRRSSIGAVPEEGSLRLDGGAADVSNGAGGGGRRRNSIHSITHKPVPKPKVLDDKSVLSAPAVLQKKKSKSLLLSRQEVLQSLKASESADSPEGKGGQQPPPQQHMRQARTLSQKFETSGEKLRPHRNVVRQQGQQQQQQQQYQQPQTNSLRFQDQQQQQQRHSYSYSGDVYNRNPQTGLPRNPDPEEPNMVSDDMTFATKKTIGTISSDVRNKIKGMKVPKGDVTIVFTDIQGSTSLWESDPHAMKEGLDLHDKIMRKCYTKHNGYEIQTEGDAFILAFQHPVDALAFALRTQVNLYKQDWPAGILRHPDAKEERGAFRGYRVRMGMHHGPTRSRVHPTTGRTLFEGETMKIAKRVEAMCHGGQILATIETWRAVSGMAEQYLGSPQVVDCGEHLLWEVTANEGGKKAIVSRQVVQLVPKQLAFDYSAARGRSGKFDSDAVKDGSLVKGRQFPELETRRKLSTSFIDAPHENGRVTIMFVYTVGMDRCCSPSDDPDVREKNMSVLAKIVRAQLMKLDPPGYECQEDNGSWMLAFDRMARGVTFGLNLRDALASAPFWGNLDNYARVTMLKIGIHSGPYACMNPHPVTGRADYFGPLVNRAARIASAASPGHVCVGVPLASGEVAESPDFGSRIQTKFMGNKQLKGLTFDMAMFSCYYE